MSAGTRSIAASTTSGWSARPARPKGPVRRTMPRNSSMIRWGAIRRHGPEQRLHSGDRARRAGRAERQADGRALGVVAVLVGGGQRRDIAQIGVQEAEFGGGVHPGHQIAVEGVEGLAVGRGSGDLLMHARDHGDALQRVGGRAVGGDHGRLARALHAQQRLAGEDRMFPDAGAHARLGQFQDDRADSADAERDRIGVDAPGDAVGPVEAAVAGGAQIVDPGGPEGRALRCGGRVVECGVGCAHGHPPDRTMSLGGGDPGAS